MKISFPLGLFIAGASCFLLLFLLRHARRPLAVLGGVMWVAAYFGVLADNYKRKAPVHTRGGMLKYEEKPGTYRFVYGFMAVVGALFLLVFLALIAFSG